MPVRQSLGKSVFYSRPGPPRRLQAKFKYLLPRPGQPVINFLCTISVTRIQPKRYHQTGPSGSLYTDHLVVSLRVPCAGSGSTGATRRTWALCIIARFMARFPVWYLPERRIRADAIGVLAYVM